MELTHQQEEYTLIKVNIFKSILVFDVNFVIKVSQNITTL